MRVAPPFPVLAVALVAALACRDEGRPTATINPADSADQVLLGMSHYVTEDGVQRARVVERRP